jgi:hypothetical protein
MTSRLFIKLPVCIIFFLFGCESPESTIQKVNTCKNVVADTENLSSERSKNKFNSMVRERPYNRNLPTIDSQFIFQAYDDIYFGLQPIEDISSMTNYSFSYRHTINQEEFQFTDDFENAACGLYSFKLLQIGSTPINSFDRDYISEFANPVTIKYGNPSFSREVIPADPLTRLKSEVFKDEKPWPKDNRSGRWLYVWTTPNKRIQLGYIKDYEEKDEYGNRTLNYKIVYQFTSLLGEKLVTEFEREKTNQTQFLDSKKF